jgi:hypothetical protein
MLKWAFRLLGVRALKTTVAGGKRPPILDVGLGFTLLRDRRVPVATKLIALLLGIAAVFALSALELPVEMLIAALLNVPGIGLDFVIEGVEIIAGPILFGSLFLLRLAPRHIVEQLRTERYRMFTPSMPPEHSELPKRRAYRRA